MNRNAKRKAAQARRNVLLVVALMLVVCVASIGGTIAWLTDKTEAVTNTFAPSNIDLKLEETVPTNKTANMIPGGVIAKNPTAIISNDVKAYLFVEIKESTEPDLDTYIKWEIATGWEKLKIEDDYFVYYRVVDKGEGQKFGILKDNQVNVPISVTKENMDAIEGKTQPTLSFTAYAIQYENGNGSYFTPDKAWEQVKPAS